MKAKYLSILGLVLFLTLNTKAQFSINTNGLVSLVSNTQTWETAFRTTVSNYNSYAYNLRYSGQDRFFVHASGYLWCSQGGYFGSDSTLKENIEMIDSPLLKITKLNGYEYNFKSILKNNTDKTKYLPNENKVERRLGLIAQEVKQIFPGIVKTMPDSTLAISYVDLIAPIIESIKEQQNQIETLKRIVFAQEQDLLKLKKYEDCFCYGDTIPNKSNVLTDSDFAILYDNVPNPFSEDTEIKYYVPESANSSSLMIFNMEGTEIKSYSIDQKGNGKIIIEGSELSAGMYLFTLIIDEKIIDTKRMIKTKY